MNYLCTLAQSTALSTRNEILAALEGFVVLLLTSVESRFPKSLFPFYSLLL